MTNKPFLRFSLRTLLLTVLLIASSATLWWNWDPWAPALTIRTNLPIRQFGFSPGGKYLYTLEDPPWDEEIEIKRGRTFTLYDPHTGKELLKRQHVFAEVKFSPTDRFFMFERRGGENTGIDSIFECETGNRITLSDFAEGRTIPDLSFSSHESFALIRTARGHRLIRISDKKEFRFTSEAYKGSFSPNENLIALCGGKNVTVIDTGTGAIVKEWPAPGWLEPNVVFSPTRRHIAASFRKQVKANAGTTVDEGSTLLCDLESENVAGSLPGKVSDFSLDGTRLVTVGDQKAYVWNVAAPDKPLITLEGRFAYIPAHDLLVDEDGLKDEMVRVFDAKTGAPLWSAAEKTMSHCINDAFIDQETGRGPYKKYKKPSIDIFKSTQRRDILTGKVIMDFGHYRWRRAFPQGVDFYEEAYADHNSSAFITAPNNPDMKQRNTPPTEFTVWRQRRPWQWYGPATLPEFWLSAALALALLWSLHRDRTVLKSRAPNQIKNQQ